MVIKNPFTLLFGLSVAGVSAALLLYLFYKQDDELKRKGGRRLLRKCKIELEVPRECVSSVIGRGGSKIGEVQCMTNTRIYFEDDNENCSHRICVIRGTAEGAQLAKCLIESVVKNQPALETYDMFVPQHACGRIIGRNGSTIKSISRASNAKLTLEKSEDSKEVHASLKIMITGTAEQIGLAKLLVEEKVMEELEMRRRIQEGIQRRSPRRTTGLTPITSEVNVKNGSSQNQNKEQELTEEKEGFMKVYISAVDHPGRFWMQVFGPRTVDLDQLIEQMTAFYTKEENRTLHTITEPYVDQMVAAPFGDDGKWYRAKITVVQQKDDVKVVVYYVDYGDSSQLSNEQIFSLHSDFLMVRHQAIECMLAHVKPKHDIWSEEATEMFDKLCHCAQWRTVMAKVKAYTERERGQREGSPVPVVELYGRNGSEEISISNELVRHGHALYAEEEKGISAEKEQADSINS